MISSYALPTVDWATAAAEVEIELDDVETATSFVVADIVLEVVSAAAQNEKKTTL